MKIMIPVFFTLLIAQVYAQEKSLDVIYGIDNRLDVFESPDKDLVLFSKSTAAKMAPAALKSISATEFLVTSVSFEARGVCAQERFSKQVSAADCSGFLVAPDVLVTAGHCVNDEKDCSTNKWVFDFKVAYSDQFEVKVPKSSVYGCQKIISRTLDSEYKNDFAVIQLDRKVTDRKPLAYRRSGRVKEGEAIAIIGHPMGLPTKIADGARVLYHLTNYFKADLDSYGGNSGSAVFNVRTGEVEGILVRGEMDFVYNPKLGCRVSRVCGEDECRGEDVTFITNIEALLRF